MIWPALGEDCPRRRRRRRRGRARGEEADVRTSTSTRRTTPTRIGAQPGADAPQLRARRSGGARKHHHDRGETFVAPVREEKSAMPLIQGLHAGGAAEARRRHHGQATGGAMRKILEMMLLTWM